MKKKTATPSYKKILTPQGPLGQVQKNPNLDFLMNIFHIPRIFGVSGFGQWTVGQHSCCAAFIALYWSKFRNYPPEKRDHLVTLALTHDIHEAVTGDILPHFKTNDVRMMMNEIQQDIISSLNISIDQSLLNDLKLIDLISFLYEISSTQPVSYNDARKTQLTSMIQRQKEVIHDFSLQAGFDKKEVDRFIHLLEL
jgi:hypothetical protein